MARHKEFNREAALVKAMETFWRYGYEGTSMQDLVDSMGINRGSLYDTFKDKRSLFLEAVAYYETTIVNRLIKSLEAPSASKQTIIDYFNGLVDRILADPEHRGCLITNTAVELCAHDPEAEKRIHSNFKRIEQAFYQALSSSQSRGEISASQDVHALARFLTCNLQGLRVMSRVNPNLETLQDVVRVTISVLN
ncbi:MAG: TetR/AcrR family transcriptional regulator [Microcoleaceae cyanobacterium]